MAWEKRGKSRYFYKARRVGGRVVKSYHGPGLQGRVAEQQELRKRAEGAAERVAALAVRTRLEEAEALSVLLKAHCDLLAEATLLAAGFRRQERHAWSRWHAARRQAVPTD